MNKARLEAFSDGVIAIILTILVLELKVPDQHSFKALVAQWPVFAAYFLSYLNIYLVWINHQDVFNSIKVVDRPVGRANGMLLFAASLVPFATAFAGEAHWRAPVAVVGYGFVMFVVALAFARLRVEASRCTDDLLQKSRQITECRHSLYFAGAFAVGMLCAGVVPRLALVVYAVVPLAAAIHSRRRPAAGHN